MFFCSEVWWIFIIYGIKGKFNFLVRCWVKLGISFGCVKEGI